MIAHVTVETVQCFTGTVFHNGECQRADFALNIVVIEQKDIETNQMLAKTFGNEAQAIPGSLIGSNILAVKFVRDDQSSGSPSTFIVTENRCPDS